MSRGKLVAVTYGADGAALFEDGREVARATPPRVDAVDGTAAGDAFAACLVVSLLEGRPREEALGRACAAGAIAASRHGAQPSLPDTPRAGGNTRAMTPDADHPRLRSGSRRRDRDPARPRLARARARRDHDRLRQPDARQDDRERAQGARARRPRRHPRLRRRRQAVRARARRRGARARRVGARRPRSAARRAAQPGEQHAVDFLADEIRRARRQADARRDRPADERRAALLARIPMRDPSGSS